jgi:hypothetical protein
MISWFLVQHSDSLVTTYGYHQNDAEFSLDIPLMVHPSQVPSFYNCWYLIWTLGIPCDVPLWLLYMGDHLKMLYSRSIWPNWRRIIHTCFYDDTMVGPFHKPFSRCLCSRLSGPSKQRSHLRTNLQSSILVPTLCGGVFSPGCLKSRDPLRDNLITDHKLVLRWTYTPLAWPRLCREQTTWKWGHPWSHHGILIYKMTLTYSSVREYPKILFDWYGTREGSTPNFLPDYKNR